MELAVHIDEAARRAGVSRSTIYNAIKAHELELRKRGRSSLIRVEDLMAWVDSWPKANFSKTAA